jgi:hypothetical protein
MQALRARHLPSTRETTPFLLHTLAYTLSRLFSTNILFILSGAFVGLEQIIARRNNKGVSWLVPASGLPLLVSDLPS